VSRALTALLTATILATGAACGGGGGGGGGGGETGGEVGNTPAQLEGLITEVSRAGGQIDGVTLKTDDGKTHVIALDPAVDYGFDPELLEQYRQQRQRVNFGVERREGRLYATVIL
jgi:hypothetical protein